MTMRPNDANDHCPTCGGPIHLDIGETGDYPMAVVTGAQVDAAHRMAAAARRHAEAEQAVMVVGSSPERLAAMIEALRDVHQAAEDFLERDPSGPVTLAAVRGHVSVTA